MIRGQEAVMAAKAASKAATKTTLALMQVEVPVGLYAATQGPAKTAEFDSAGPNGGKLKYEMRGVAAPVEEQTPDAPAEKGDPLGSDPDAAKREEMHERAIAGVRRTMERDPAMVDGEFRQVLVEEGTGEVVEPERVRKGVRLDDGSFVDCTAQLAEITDRTKLDEMRIVAFIDVGQVPRERVSASYYVGTDEPDALPVLRLLYDAMREKRRAAVVRWSARSRQSLGVLVPYRNGLNGQPTLMALKLAWAEDFRQPPVRAQLGSVSVPEHAVSQAMTLVQALSYRREALDGLRDDAIALREELRAKAEAGEVEPVESAGDVAPEEGRLGDLLAASLATVQGDG